MGAVSSMARADCGENAASRQRECEEVRREEDVVAQLPRMFLHPVACPQVRTEGIFIPWRAGLLGSHG